MYVCVYKFIGYSGDIYNNLTAGWHSIEVLFTPDGLSQVILLPSSLGFNILPGDDYGAVNISVQLSNTSCIP